MKEINYEELLPEDGVIAVMGRNIWDPLLRAAAYKNLKVIPLTPDQWRLITSLNIPSVKGMPDYFYIEMDWEKTGFFTVGYCESPLTLRLYETLSDRVVVFLRRKYHTVSVEYLSHLREDVEPAISLVGEIVARRENFHGNTVVDIVPYEDDMEFTRSKLKDVPGVLEVGILPTIPHKKIVIR